MTFTFEITRISRLARAHVVILDGKLLEGSVLTDSTAKLLHSGQHFPLRIKGVSLGSERLEGTNLCFTVDLREAAMAIAAVGDKLVGA